MGPAASMACHPFHMYVYLIAATQLDQAHGKGVGPGRLSMAQALHVCMHPILVPLYATLAFPPLSQPT